MDVDDMHGSVLQAARVLTHGGALCACVTHPMADAGRFESRDGDAPFIIEGSYLGERRWTDIEEERDGLRMHFKGWAYSLQDYFGAMERAALLVEAVREPAISGGPIDRSASQNRWRRTPNFLMWRGVKP